MGESLAPTLVVLSGEVAGHSLVIRGTHETGSETPHGTIRLIFRRTFNPQRYRFKIEAIYPNLRAAQTGFLGFAINGDVKLSEQEICVGTAGKVFRHNVWEWQGWR
jgi:hypothetical protein